MNVMAKPFKNLREEMAPERRKRNQLRTELALLEMSLAEIRQHRRQVDASRAAAQQENEIVDGKELQNDMLLSNLVNLISDMGGTLKLVAQFPEEEIVINSFALETTIPQIQQ
jgi:septal ring factor EnvC (AmiA/AmiB activator)